MSARSRPGQGHRAGREVRPRRPGPGSHRRVREARADRPPGRRDAQHHRRPLHPARPERPGRPLLPQGRRRIRAARALSPRPWPSARRSTSSIPTTPTTPSSSADLYAQQGFVAEAKAVYVAVAGRFDRGEQGRRGRRHLREDRQARPRGPSRRGRPWPACTGTLGNLDARPGTAQRQRRRPRREGPVRGRRGGPPRGPGRPARGRPAAWSAWSRSTRSRARPTRPSRSSKEELAAAPDSVQLLNILGNIHFEAGDTKKAEEIFTRIVTGHPLNVNARIKLGRIQILKDKLDQAYELFEPLINNLVKKHRDEKAIGLLGPHPGEPEAPPAGPRAPGPDLPVEQRGQEARGRGPGHPRRAAQDRRQGADDRRLQRARRAPARRRRPGPGGPGPAPGAGPGRRGGPGRDARAFGQGPRGHPGGHGPGRPLHPAGPRPDRPPPPREPPLPLSRGPPDREEDRRPRRGPDAHGRGRDPPPRREDQPPRSASSGRRRPGRRPRSRKAAGRGPSPREAGRGRRGRGRQGRATSRPRPDRRSDRRRPVHGRRPRGREGQHRRHLRRDGHHPLRQRGARRADSTTTSSAAAAEELRWIAAARGPPAPRRRPRRYERELTGIVAEFRKDLRGTVAAPETPRPTTSSGWPSWSQGLTGEAVEELTQAAEDQKLAVESYTLISQCFRQKRNFDEAAKWLKTALAETKAGHRPVLRPRLRARGDPGGVRRPGRAPRRSTARSATGIPASGTPPPGSRASRRPPAETGAHSSEPEDQSRPQPQVFLVRPPEGVGRLGRQPDVPPQQIADVGGGGGVAEVELVGIHPVEEPGPVPAAVVALAAGR
ncbi:MAG: tetratricopeptide repeat protein [Ignavibacteriales bacterium]|nr:tetratricopeptide repeat protein [Ignavibacteriales bacterium]